MRDIVSSQTSPPATASGATPAGAPTASVVPSPRAHPTRIPVPTPSLKPTETITWIKLERPRFAIGEIIISSLTIVGIVFLVAVVAGLVLGYVRSKRTGTHGTRGLGLR